MPSRLAGSITRPRAVSTPILRVIARSAAFRAARVLGGRGNHRQMGFGIGEVPLQERAHPAEQRRVPAQQRLPQLLGAALEVRDDQVQLGEVSQLQQRDHTEASAQQPEQQISGLVRETHDLPSVIEPRMHVSWTGQGVAQRRECLGLQRRVADPTCDCPRFLGQRSGPVRVSGVAAATERRASNDDRSPCASGPTPASASSTSLV